MSPPYLNLEGDLDLARLLERISAERATGVLTIQGDLDIIAISFLEGCVVAADALNESVEEGLGDVLVQDGLVQPEVLEALSIEHQAGSGRILDLLVERRFLTRLQLLAALERHTSRLLLEALLWRHGEFKFYGVEEVSYEEGFRPIPVDELLEHAARQLAGLPSQGPLLTGSAVFERVHDAVAPPVRLSPDEERVLASLDGRRATLELQRATDLPEASLLILLHRLERDELIRRLPVAPPSPVAGEGSEAERARAPRREWGDPGRVEEVVTRGAALAAGILAVAALFAQPLTVALPFPWQEAAAAEALAAQRATLHNQLDQAARTFHLLEGRYPETLDLLLGRRLLGRRDLVDPAGFPLAYASGDASYVVHPVEGRRIRGRAAGGMVAGNFLLDPELAFVPDVTEAPPLVLLD